MTMQEVKNKVKDLPGIQTEVCGSWLWATGNTYAVKNELKAAGMFYSHNKAAWYWHNGGYHKTSKHEWSLEEIRSRFSSTILTA